MCGVFGFNFNDKGLAERMCSRLVHRGPDHNEIYEAENLTLGYTRLSIIDLKSGNQPFTNEEGSIIVFFNGEIYNYRALRERLVALGHKFQTESDTEVISHAYEEYGDACVSHLNGMFAFALYDSKNKKVFLARDRLGIKPLYYYFNEGIFAFASEIKALLEMNEIKRKVYLESLGMYLTYRYCPGRMTMIKDIYKLLPGNYLIFSDNMITTKRYWSLDFTQTNYGKDFYVSRFKELLGQAVEDTMISDVPVGLLLSGGIDSSSIAAMMDGRQIDTFTVGFDEGSKNEFDSAKIISEEFCTRHHEIMMGPESMKHMKKVIYHLDEPIADPTALPNYILARKARDYVKVLINGDGADEIFCGYEQYKLMKMRMTYGKLPTQLKNMAHSVLKRSDEPFFMKLKDFLAAGNTLPESYSSLISIFGTSEKRSLVNEHMLAKIHLDAPAERTEALFNHTHDELNKMSYHDIETFLPDNMLVKFDKMTMAHSVEGRVPFCDHRLAEFAASLPVRYKLRGNTDKYIIRESMKGLLPPEILRKKKQRFYVPTDNWLNRGVLDHLKSTLDENADVASHYFEKGYIDKLLNHKKMVSSTFLKMNRLTNLYYSRQIWTIANFLDWHKIFIEGDYSSTE